MLATGLTLGPELDFRFGAGCDLAAWSASGTEFYRRSVPRPRQMFQLSGHRTSQGMLLEFEPLADKPECRAGSSYDALRRFMERIEALPDVRAVGAGRGPAHPRDDRVQPDADVPFRCGLERHRDRRGRRRRAAVLPGPAVSRRRTFPRRRGRFTSGTALRLIPDADYQPVPIDPPVSPVDGQPLDLTPVSLRSVSPVHLRYMRNMGTAGVDVDLAGG